jgi:choline dehydrogenase
MHQPALDPYRGAAISPTEDLVTDQQLDDYVREHGETAYHPSCTCAMGEDNDSVVNGQGLVHGIDGLRVVDASIMPNIISGNLNATTIMLAEKIVDKMKGVQLPRSTADYYVANGAPLRAEPMRDYLSTV